MFFRHLGFDLKSAWHGVRSGGLASLVAVAALAVGIGATTLATTVAYNGLFRPLTFPDDSRLITLEKVWDATGLVSGIRLNEFSAWRDGLAGAARLSAFTGERVTLRDGGTAQDARAAYIVGDWFQVLGAQPLAGRLIDDSAPADEAVVSQAFASRRGASDPAAILGHTFTIGARPIVVVGVLPASFSVVDEADIWVLARSVSALAVIGSNDARTYRMVARVAPGHSIDAARAVAQTAMRSVSPDSQAAQMRAQPLRDRLLGNAKPVLLAFLVGSMLVLFAACANVAMLLVNRAIARAREFAVRVALGASRGRLLTVATLETAMLGAAGTVGGWWIARAASAFLQSRAELDLPFLATRVVGQCDHHQRGVRRRVPDRDVGGAAAAGLPPSGNRGPAAERDVDGVAGGPALARRTCGRATGDDGRPADRRGIARPDVARRVARRSRVDVTRARHLHERARRRIARTRRTRRPRPATDR